MYLNQLLQQLKQKLAPLYLLSSDVPLLLQEARDAIRQAAKTSGFIQQEILHIEPGFNWNRFAELTQNLNLFSEKSLIDLRNPNSKFDEAGIAAIMHYCEALPPDRLLIISTPKLTAAQQKTRWYKAIDSKGITVTIWPITIKELPHWIQQRLQHAKKTIDPASCKLLAELTEGNLLAAKQAIDKLILLCPNKITNQEVLDIINDNARYSIFDLVNYALAGEAEKVIRIIEHLREEGTEPTIINWALAREIRELIVLLEKINQGDNPVQVFNTQWQSRRPLLKLALARLKLSLLLKLLQQIAAVDRIIKGVKLGNVWDELLSISLALAGRVAIDDSL